MGKTLEADLLLKDLIILTMDEQGTFYERGSIAIKGGRIIGIGSSLSCRAREVIAPKLGLAMPGLIDCHTHQCLTRGICEDLPLIEWLERICFPLDRAHTPQTIRAAAYLNQLEMIRGGITTFVDIYRHPAETARVLVESGLRGILSPQVIDTMPGVGERIDDTESLLQEWQGRGDGRVSIWVGLHAPYSCSLPTLEKGIELAKKYDVGVHIHLAETEEEVDHFYALHGISPLEYLKQAGISRQRVLAAHCVHLSERDQDLLADLDVAVAYNPTSNMKLASGVAPIPTLLKAGVRIGLGTDSILSNNNLDMFEEMRVGALLQKVHRRDAGLMSCREMLAMATREGARCLGMQSEIGSLEVGKRADIIVLNLNRPHFWPLMLRGLSNLEQHLVYSANAGDVDTTIVDGKILLREGRVTTITEEEVLPLVMEATKDLIKRAGLPLPPPI